MDISKLAIDVDALSGGRWIGNLPALPGVRLKVRGTGSPEARRLRNRLLRSLKAEERDAEGVITAEADERVQATILLDGLLLDWEGFTNGGKPVPYDKALAKTWLTDPRFYHFAEAVMSAAWRVDSGEATEAEAAGKN